MLHVLQININPANVDGKLLPVRAICTFRQRTQQKLYFCLPHGECGVPLFVCTHSTFHVKYTYLFSCLTSNECSAVHSAYHEGGGGVITFQGLRGKSCWTRNLITSKISKSIFRLILFSSSCSWLKISPIFGREVTQGTQ